MVSNLRKLSLSIMRNREEYYTPYVIPTSIFKKISIKVKFDSDFDCKLHLLNKNL